MLDEFGEEDLGQVAEEDGGEKERRDVAILGRILEIIYFQTA